MQFHFQAQVHSSSKSENLKKNQEQNVVVFFNINELVTHTSDSTYSATILCFTSIQFHHIERMKIEETITSLSQFFDFNHNKRMKVRENIYEKPFHSSL